MDRNSKTEKYIVIPNSPVEFALSGPVGGRDRILVKSENAGLDLIGLAAQPTADSYKRSSSDVLGSIMKARRLNFVTSFPLEDIDPEEDSRRSKFGFAWQGYISRSGMEQVQKTLNLQLPDLRRAIRNKDVEEIEWALSPVIYRCTEGVERNLRSRRLVLIFVALYATIGLLTVLLEFLRRFIFK